MAKKKIAPKKKAVKKIAKKVIKKTVKPAPKKVVKKASHLEILQSRIKGIVDSQKGRLPKSIEVITLTDSAFNPKMSVPYGFGYQDLKPLFQELVLWLMNNYQGITFLPTAQGKKEVKISIRA